MIGQAIRAATLTAALALLVAATPASARAADAAVRCQALTGQGVAAALQPAADDLPVVCGVQGSAAAHVDFQLLLPAVGWNGKVVHVDGQYAHIGCAGKDCGAPLTSRGCGGVLRRGYACLVDDAGQGRTVVDVPADPAAAYDGAHLAAVAGKALAARFYGRPPIRSYFLGCSIGGRQGLIEAQAFPADYDGIVAGAPAVDFAANARAVLWNVSALLGPDGRSLFPAPDGGYLQPDLRLFHRAVLAHCDLNDGVQDGMVGDPRRCAFDPAQLQCPGAKAPDCLAPDQAAAIRKILGGPVDPAGGRPYGRALMGSEVNWGYSYLAPGGDDAVRRAMLAALRSTAGQAGYGPVSPDLAAFKARGGKLIAFQGWSDHEALPQGIVDYYAGVARKGGQAQTEAFFRLFMVPGMDHCGNGVSADKTDWLATLEAWVEKGEAPDQVVVARLKDIRRWPTDAAYWAPPAWDPAAVQFTRPLSPYPRQARYRGYGDANSAESFLAVVDRPAAVQ